MTVMVRCKTVAEKCRPSLERHVRFARFPRGAVFLDEVRARAARFAAGLRLDAARRLGFPVFFAFLRGLRPATAELVRRFLAGMSDSISDPSGSA